MTVTSGIVQSLIRRRCKTEKGYGEILKGLTVKEKYFLMGRVSGCLMDLCIGGISI